MGFLGGSLVVAHLLLCVLCIPNGSAQTASKSAARALDVLLQDYGYRAFVNPITGISYDGAVPSNLTGIKIAAMRLRSGSLRRRGVAMFKEFEIPVGVTERPYVERLVLVYQNLGNWSMVYYPLDGYTYLTPVLGLLAYDASNLSAKNLPQLNIRASGDPILIKFPNVRSAPPGSVPKCAWFNLQGSVNISNTVSNNVCSMYEQGHFSIVVESVAPSPAPISPTPSGGAPNVPGPSGQGGGKKKNNSKVWIIVGSVLGGLALLALLSFLILCARKFKQRKSMHKMVTAAEAGEALRMTSIGEAKAPSATVTRTQPALESEYVP